jgi:hypothetical protein
MGRCFEELPKGIFKIPRRRPNGLIAKEIPRKILDKDSTVSKIKTKL